MDNRFIERYRDQSIILGNRNGNTLNQPVIEGNVSNLQSHLMQIKGNEQGIYFDSHHKEVLATLTTLREQEKELAQRWDQHCTDQLKIGNLRPKRMTPKMQEQQDKISARLQVTEEEIEELERLLSAAMKQQAKSKGSLLTHPKHWGSGSLRNGVLESIGPWTVEPDSEGLLRISDPDSPYHTMPVWRFKAEILKPMSMENVYRHKQEETEALKLNRPRQKVMYPIPGKWNKDSDLIEYENYHNDIIKKLKQSVE